MQRLSFGSTIIFSWWLADVHWCWRGCYRHTWTLFQLSSNSWWFISKHGYQSTCFFFAQLYVWHAMLLQEIMPQNLLFRCINNHDLETRTCCGFPSCQPKCEGSSLYWLGKGINIPMHIVAILLPFWSACLWYGNWTTGKKDAQEYEDQNNS